MYILLIKIFLYLFLGHHGGRKEGGETTWPTGRIIWQPPVVGEGKRGKPLGRLAAQFKRPPCSSLVCGSVSSFSLLFGHLVPVGRPGRVRGGGGGLGSIGFGSRAQSPSLCAICICYVGLFCPLSFIPLSKALYLPETTRA